MFLRKLLHSTTGKYVMSVILGLGIATLFRNFCVGKDCIVRYAPPKEEVEGKTFKHDGSCYQYVPESISCDSNNEVLDTK